MLPPPALVRQTIDKDKFDFSCCLVFNYEVKIIPA
jgi:hypothetical protein